MKTPFLTLNTGTWTNKVYHYTLRQLNTITNRTSNTYSPQTLLSYECASM